MDRHLVVFTRYPSFGTGKRRLAAGVGNATALRFQRVSLAHTMQRLSGDGRWKTWLAVTPDRSGPWPAKSGVVKQGKGDLGQRLARVSARLPRGPVLFIGSDVPGITKELVSKAFHLLGGHDAVIGPSSDGGYWAVGLRRRPRTINPFGDVRWSSPNALEDTLANLQGHSVGRLSPLDDIDDADTMRRFPGWALLHASLHGEAR